jgi:hypothetical protein
MNIFQKIRHYGLARSVNKIIFLALCKIGWYEWRVRNAPRYNNPTPNDLDQIERDLRKIEVEIKDYFPSVEAFRAFQAENYFPDDYHGGRSSGVWNEKLLEHWIASEMFGFARLWNE